MTARVVWWNSDRGHGFIRTEKGEDIFMHHASFIDDANASSRRGAEANVHAGQEVEFDPTAGTVGTVAVNVKLL